MRPTFAHRFPQGDLESVAGLPGEGSEYQSLVDLLCAAETLGAKTAATVVASRSKCPRGTVDSGTHALAYVEDAVLCSAVPRKVCALVSPAGKGRRHGLVSIQTTVFAGCRDWVVLFFLPPCSFEAFKEERMPVGGFPLSKSRWIVVHTPSVAWVLGSRKMRAGVVVLEAPAVVDWLTAIRLVPGEGVGTLL